MRRFVLALLVAVGIAAAQPLPARAASEAECAIWLCLPGGFPSGCSAAYSAFRYRVKRRMSPLPPLSSCTTGPNGVGTDGRYELGYEAYQSCNDGYRLRQIDSRYSQQAMCYPNTCTPGAALCDGYAAVRRAQPNFIKIWVKGEYLGEYWY